MEFLTYHPEFSKVDQKIIDSFIEISKQVVKEKPFGKVYEQALYAYTAHKLAVKGYLNTDLKGNPIFSNGEGFKTVASKTAGGLSISYGQQGSAGSSRASDGDLDSTNYGKEYLSLRSLVSPFGIVS